jgi:hypothetical protein
LRFPQRRSRDKNAASQNYFQTRGMKPKRLSRHFPRWKITNVLACASRSKIPLVKWDRQRRDTAPARAACSWCFGIKKGVLILTTPPPPPLPIFFGSGNAHGHAPPVGAGCYLSAFFLSSEVCVCGGGVASSIFFEWCVHFGCHRKVLFEFYPESPSRGYAQNKANATRGTLAFCPAYTAPSSSPLFLEKEPWS